MPSNIDNIDTHALEDIIEEIGLSWKIVKKDSWGEGRVLFECVNEDNLSIATISTAIEDNKKVLQLSFFSTTEITAPLPNEDLEKVFQLASVLYGGFDEEDQFYQNFLSTNEETEFIERVLEDDKESIRWQNSINDIDCFVGYRNLESDAETQTPELIAIILSS